MLGIHIIAGALVLLAGFVALYSRKGGTLHRWAGRGFVLAMLLMAALGSTLALVRITDRGTALIGLLCCYLVATGWLAVARDPARARRPLQVLAGVAAAIGASGLALGLPAIAQGARVDHLPAAPIIVFASFAVVGAFGDLRVLRRRALPARDRMVRHLWRMGLALWIATSSFFLGQARFLPQVVRDHGWHTVPVFAVLVTVVFWFVRWRWWRPRAPSTAR